MKAQKNLNVFKVILNIPVDIKEFFNNNKNFNSFIKKVFLYYITNPSLIQYNPDNIFSLENSISETDNFSFYLNKKIKPELNNLASSNLRSNTSQSKLILYIIYLNLNKNANYYHFLL